MGHVTITPCNTTSHYEPDVGPFWVVHGKGPVSSPPVSGSDWCTTTFDYNVKGKPDPPAKPLTGSFVGVHSEADEGFHSADSRHAVLWSFDGNRTPTNVWVKLTEEEQRESHVKCSRDPMLSDTHMVV